MRDDLWIKLTQLTEIPAVSGQEQRIVRFLWDELAGRADAAEIDAMGNVYIQRKGIRPGPEMLIAAHTDQIGATVKYVDEAGFLRMEKVGGTLDALLVGRKVRVGDIPGVVGVKPGHYQTEEERRKVPTADQLYVDVGAGSRDEVYEMGIRIGTQITYDDQLTRLTDGNRFTGAAVDDRAGCAVLWQLLDEMEDADFAGTISAVFTVQEEIGLRGAGVAAENLRPDFGIALDTIPCGGTPDVKDTQLHTRIGDGPVLPLASGRRCSAPVHPAVRDLLISTAEDNEIPYQPMVFAGGNNDAAAMQVADGGIPAGSVTLPRRYSHSPVEMGDIRDMKAATDLLRAVAHNMDKTGDFSFLSE